MNLREQFEKETGEPWSYDGYLATKSYIEWLEQRNKEQVGVLEDCKNALGNWVKTYASDQCDQEDVDKAKLEIYNRGGTLAYIAKINSKIEEQLKKSGEL